MKPLKTKLLALCAIAALASLPDTSIAQEQQLLRDLRGKWKFQIGDQAAWSDPSCNDADWDSIYAPSAWEDQGYPGYDGYAWYRKHFVASPDWQGRDLYLHLGTIDDVDEVYVNGHFIAFGGIFPPHYQTAYSWTREYPLPNWALNFGGANVIAIRVYDHELSGGITSGKLGVYGVVEPLRADQTLSGTWKIMTGDNSRWSEVGFDDSPWREIAVPIFWETQGMKDYDGFAWYRFHFRPSSTLSGKQLIMLVGKVDDIDETYLNGQRIGHTGTMRARGEDINPSDEYRQLRAYTIPPELLKFNGDNVIAVRVFDKMLHGGIWDGPIGLITRENYRDWTDHHRTRLTPWEVLKELFR
ncbi:MAG TPA: beta galactosidase jelly roll domain-containing protein [Bacteroidota bacterium]|nr:beta galactosidase jelly roll domain-containing protein [Bacteroidota bacterium]